jgi:hypothetical protein
MERFGRLAIGPGTRGNPMGCDWGLIGDSEPSGSTAKTEEVSAIHWFAASGPKGDGKFATGGRLGLTSEDPRRYWRDSPRRGRTSEADGPEPGHLIEEARSEETGGRALRRRGGLARPVSPVEVREGMHAPDGLRRVRAAA